MSVMIPIALGAWPLATMALFRSLGPRRAALIALFGGFLLLPRGDWRLGILTMNKQIVSGLALLAGVLVSDPRALLRARPRPADLPMIAFVLLPLASLAANGFADREKSLDQVFLNFAAWSLPYLVGRLYFGDREGPRRVAIGVVVAGLISVPIFGFEMIMGPRWYLGGLVYGIPPHGQMVARLGGWRPEGFQTNGIEAGAWLALSATVAAWVWLRGAWRPRAGPGWLVPLLLMITTVATRGVYGYISLAVGLVAAGATHFLRTRAILVALAALPPAYIASRVSGLWDGRQLADLAGDLGRSGTVGYRLRAESEYIKKVMEHGAAFGFGGSESGIFDYWSMAHLWADGWWVHQIRSGGIAGLSAFLLAMFLVPIAAGIALPAGRSRGASPGSISRVLTLLVILHLLASVHNMDLLTPTPLIGGSLVGLFLTRRVARPDIEDHSTAKKSHLDTPRVTPLVAAAFFLVILEILGRMPRPKLPPSRPEAINLDVNQIRP